MRSSRALTVVCAHAEGEVGRVVTGGLALRGTPARVREALLADDRLRRFLLNEPRGGVFGHANLLLPPTDLRADAAFVVLEPDGLPLMSGSNAMCVTAVLLETGIVPMTEPVTRLVLETPAGLASVDATCADGRCLSVTVELPPARLVRADLVLTVPGLGEVRCDLAWGGALFALVDPAPLGLALVPEAARALVEAGERIRRAAGPEVEFTGFVAAPERDGDGGLGATHAIVVPPGRIDRSPCGTGTAARLAVLHARGLIGPGEAYRARSLLGTSFTALLAESPEGVRVRVTGRAWLTAIHHELLDPDDPFPEGYRLADTWPGC
jgi:proline racemase